jgi:hypothetical protein
MILYLTTWLTRLRRPFLRSLAQASAAPTDTDDQRFEVLQQLRRILHRLDRRKLLHGRRQRDAEMTMLLCRYIEDVAKQIDWHAPRLCEIRRINNAAKGFEAWQRDPFNNPRPVRE